MQADLAALADRVEGAEERVRRAMRAEDKARREVAAARKALVDADKAYTRAALEQELANAASLRAKIEGGERG